MSFSIRRCNTNKFLNEIDNGVKVDGYVPLKTTNNEELQEVKKNDINKKKEPGSSRIHKTIYAFSDR